MPVATGKRAVATIGNFDGCHAGHAFVASAVAQRAHAQGALALAVTFADHPRSITGTSGAPAVITPPSLRSDMLRHAGFDSVLTLDFGEIRTMSAADFIGMLHSRHGVDTLMMGFNNHIGHDRRDAASLSAESPHGVHIVALPEAGAPQSVSSSQVRRAIVDGHLRRAADILGHPFILRGQVVPGRRLGRTIGFPTANIAAEPAQLLPPDGVYMAFAAIPGHSGTFRAIVNIGRRPTVESDSNAPRSIEAHVLDFAADIYGLTIDVAFAGRLRDEMKFDSLDALRSRLEADRDAARSYPAPGQSIFAYMPENS